MPYIGLLQYATTNLPRLIETAQQSTYNVVAVPINCMEMPLELERQSGDCSYPDLLLTSDQWNSKVILMLSDDIDCDSGDKRVRQNSEAVLRRDISWASHLQSAGYIMLRLRSGRNQNLAHVLTEIKGLLLLQIPLYNPKKVQSMWLQEASGEEAAARLAEEEENPWDWWNRFRWSADFHPRIKVALELHEGYKPSVDVVRRWLGEPVEIVIIPSSMFIRNSYNYAVLPKAWQEILKLFVSSHINLMVSTDTQDNSLKIYAEYLNNFVEKHRDKHELQSFEDCLEIPLQPLYDNLDCSTYEIFEKDPVKYKLYQDAITAALLDRVSEEEKAAKLTIIMVLGAGRGPLVRAALNAAESTKRKIRVYIIEKNPNAIRTLTCITRKLWHNKDIHIFSKDMREFSPPEQADILVSELLGSFGDNELSPECLDCAQKLLKPDGISIPCKSTSYINPIMSSKLYNCERQINRNKPTAREKYFNPPVPHVESGYATLLKNIFNISFPQKLFEFVHPNPEVPIDNSRYKILRFEVTMDCVMHGIAGYFDSVLYKDISISINPMTHTKGMFSWFPMYFPITDPHDLKKGQVVEIHFWRCISKQKVWYQWSVAEPFCTHIHNHGGNAYPIYLS